MLTGVPLDTKRLKSRSFPPEVLERGCAMAIEFGPGLCEEAAARFQGKHVTEIAAKLAG